MSQLRSKRSYYKPYNLLTRQQKWRRKNSLRNIPAISRHVGSNEISSLRRSENFDANGQQQGLLCTGSSPPEFDVGQMHDHDISDDQVSSNSVISLDDFISESLIPEILCDENEFALPEIEERPVKNPTITEIIKNWAINEVNVPKSSISRLLVGLHSIHNELPKSFKTLLPNPQLLFEPMQDGRYVHFPNWTTCLRKLLFHIYGSSDNTGTVDYFLIVNVDGLPLFRHSPDFKLYPILVTIFGFKMRPLCAGIYSSQQSLNREMPFPEILLRQFLYDIRDLQSGCVDCNGVKCSLANDGLIFSCDAPARSSLKKIVLHSGYKSCERCTVTGVYDNLSRHVCLLQTNCTHRTDHDFRLQTDKRHHKGASVLADFGVGMVTRFTLDYMHLSCLGCMKRLLLWWKGVKRLVQKGNLYIFFY